MKNRNNLFKSGFLLLAIILQIPSSAQRNASRIPFRMAVNLINLEIELSRTSKLNMILVTGLKTSILCNT